MKSLMMRVFGFAASLLYSCSSSSCGPAVKTESAHASRPDTERSALRAPETTALATSVPSVERRPTLGPGFRRSGPWLSFYGTAKQMGDLERWAAKYAIINIDADPDAENFTDAQLATLRAGGRNQVLSYLNIGSCERFRSYWSKAPAKLVPCRANTAAHLGAYEGYPDEVWMNVGNPSYQRLVLEHVAKRLAARGIDGFYLDNLEIVEHRECTASCRQGGLDLVRKLRETFPNLLLVMQNATSVITRHGTTNGVPFPLLLDGIAHEEVYNPRFDETAESELVAWYGLGLRSHEGRPFWIAVEDYVGNCRNADSASVSFRRGQARGFSVYVADSSASQKRVCDFAP